jgi:hypothetical protein
MLVGVFLEESRPTCLPTDFVTKKKTLVYIDLLKEQNVTWF